jgi:hypothetical protein
MDALLVLSKKSQEKINIDFSIDNVRNADF